MGAADLTSGEIIFVETVKIEIGIQVAVFPIGGVMPNRYPELMGTAAHVIELKSQLFFRTQSNDRGCRRGPFTVQLHALYFRRRGALGSH